MKAIVLTKYGHSDVLQLQQVEQPSSKNDQVLVKVNAASVNDWDWFLLRGTPFFIRLLCDFFKPKIQIHAAEIAGIV